MSDEIIKFLIEHKSQFSHTNSNNNNNNNPVSPKTPLKNIIPNIQVDAFLEQYNLPDLTLTILRLLEYQSINLFPNELLNGVINIEKLRKEYKRYKKKYYYCI